MVSARVQEWDVRGGGVMLTEICSREAGAHASRVEQRRGYKEGAMLKLVETVQSRPLTQFVKPERSTTCHPYLSHKRMIKTLF